MNDRHDFICMNFVMVFYYVPKINVLLNDIKIFFVIKTVLYDVFAYPILLCDVSLIFLRFSQLTREPSKNSETFTNAVILPSHSFRKKYNFNFNFLNYGVIFFMNII